MDIEIGSFCEALTGFDALFYRIREVCWQLGEKLGGDVNFNAELHWLYGKGGGGLGILRGGEPPQ